MSREDTAGVRMCLDMGHHKSYDGTKMSYQKTRRINMIVASEHQTKLRQKEIQEIDRGRPLKSMRRRRRITTSPRHTQRAGNALEKLVRDKQGAAAIGLYSFSLNT